ncbi:MAG: alkaline phosphatase family protein [Bryobacteraceae bacterium]|jgi:predicted AlkP superfamily phosphohydrolase/phosphomutase/Flp pilus assembly protein TadD
MSRLLLVGWDAADWKVIDPLLARGEMPHLASVIENGVRANLATIYPPLSPMLWTSIATGKRPQEHGILGFSEPSDDGLSVRPISNLGRRTKALWNILNQNGKRSIVVGWWPSHPAEPIRGAMVSNHFKLFPEQDPASPIPPGMVWPPAWAERLADLRMSPMEITGEILQLFVPEFGRVDQDKDKSLHDLAEIVAETMSVHAAATDLIENEPWDFAAIYHNGIDHFSHRFMRYHAGKAQGRETDPALYAGVVANAYRYHDVMLGRMLALAGPDCAVMVVSDHGFHSDRLLPDYIPAEAAGPAVEHRHFGVFALRAPGALRGERIYGASVLDIAPTVLHLFGIPAGLDMRGKVLLNAFENQQLLPPVPSWDEIAGEDGRHPPERQYDGVASAESLRQLVALGYVAPPDGDARKAVDECLAETRYNLARCYMDSGRPDVAAGILRELIRGDPEQGRYHQHLFHCALQMGDPGEGGRVLEAFDRACAEFAPRAAAELERRRAGRADEDLEDRKPADRRERYERRELLEKADGFAMPRLLMRCRLALLKSRSAAQKETARALLDELAGKPGAGRALALFLAESYMTLRDHERALEFARRARRADPDDWQAMALEARIHLAAGRYAESANCAIESLSLIHFHPRLHYTLAVALRHLGEESRAAECLRTALKQMPAFAAAHGELAKILRRQRNFGEAALHMAEAAELRMQANERRREKLERHPVLPQPAPVPVFERAAAPPADRSRVVIVVAGLPRSGTSMMMQTLAAAGIAPYTDHRRAADADNPRGYFEHENATRLHQDASWISEARGKAVKIVAHLLPYLPAGEEYRIILMHRNLDEVIASQRAMLARLERAGGRLDDRLLARTYTKQLIQVQTWLQRRPEIQVLAVNYADVVGNPGGTCARLARFLGEPFDEAAATVAVDPSLQRQGSRVAS